MKKLQNKGAGFFKSIKAKLCYFIYRSRLHCEVGFHTRFRRWKRFLGEGPIRVLEVGGGGGPWTFELLDKGNHVVEVDVDANALKRLQDKMALFESDVDRVEIIHSHIGEYDDSTLFDEIVLFEVLEHVSDDRALMEKACKMLTPGGTMLVSTPSHNHEPFYGETISEVEDGGHVRKGYSFEDYAALITDDCEITFRDSCTDYLLQKIIALRRRLCGMFPNQWFRLMMFQLERPFAYIDGLLFKGKPDLTNFVIIEKRTH